MVANGNLDVCQQLSLGFTVSFHISSDLLFHGHLNSAAACGTAGGRNERMVCAIPEQMDSR
jgi:hypothetical protein